jgi:hypothetical protein
MSITGQARVVGSGGGMGSSAPAAVSRAAIAWCPPAGAKVKALRCPSAVATRMSAPAVSRRNYNGLMPARRRRHQWCEAIGQRNHIHVGTEFHSGVDDLDWPC